MSTPCVQGAPVFLPSHIWAQKRVRDTLRTTVSRDPALEDLECRGWSREASAGLFIPLPHCLR